MQTIKTFYLGSSSKFAKECEELSKSIEEQFRLENTRRWWIHYILDRPEFAEKSDDEFYSHGIIKAICKYDLNAIEKADIVIIYTENEYKLTGAMIELGYAMGLNKIIILFGDFKRSAMINNCIRVKNWRELEKVLIRMHATKELSTHC